MLQLYRALRRELGVINRKSHEVHSAKELERVKARLQYQKIQLIRAKKPIAEIENEINSKLAAASRPPQVKTDVIRALIADTPAFLPRVQLQNLKNVGVFLKSQRTYNELIERYNPGLTMSQEDNVSKTANRVGLQVPE
ncbi:hypothetical protein JA9_004751 [Meyerozyma sp. JA9]|nr:hypothetical protein JA9_004751 [Meyerozyma sp. JA9]